MNVAHLPVNRSNGWFCGVPLAKRCSRLRSGRAAGEDHRWRGHAHQVRRTIAVWRDPLYDASPLSPRRSNPRIRRHGNTRACGRPRVSKTADSRSRSQGVVDIGCHSMHEMVCGRPRFSIEITRHAADRRFVSHSHHKNSLGCSSPNSARDRKAPETPAMDQWSSAKLCDVANLLLGSSLFFSPWLFGLSAGAQTTIGLFIAVLAVAALAAFADGRNGSA